MLRKWILGLTAGSILCACTNALHVNEAVERVQKLVSGAVLLTLLISPLTSPDGERYALSMAEYRRRNTELTRSLQEQNEELNRLFIEQECAAYILDEAQKLGMEGRAEVRVKWLDNGFVPWSAEVTMNGAERERLRERIASELGIPPERQVWHEGN